MAGLCEGGNEPPGSLKASKKFGVDPPSGPSIRIWYADFKTRGYICKRKSTGQQQVYQPPLPPTIEDLRVRITEAIALVDRSMLQRVWQEIDYRLDVCRNNCRSPPFPVLKSWGSWLEACNYYAHHLQSVKKVVQSFNPDDAAAIQIRQELLKDRTIEKEVVDISCILVKVLKYYLRIVHGDQSLMRAVCYREQLERRHQVTWAGRLRRGLEEIGMGFIIGEDYRNKRNVWRKVKKRLKDIDRQITEGECRDKVALEIQSMIKTNWGTELYLYGGSREGRLGLIWFRLGAWRALKIVNEEGVKICPLCGRGETSHHILSESEALRKRFLPESFITSSRGHLATYAVLNNVKFCDSVGKFMAKVRHLRVELAEGKGAEKIRERVIY
ncbi:hypothetical protein ANN_13539 [Periplaneta americana]|uniref:DUF4817 domain-containing protein n=1 Tax=Periplaneta americana TaxID=6978 RepID=A0ABQ8TL52_PERAM|nr:hypothetical protein ANN_13539 [Periplaneta americana]